jgi:hypothetical protein
MLYVEYEGSVTEWMRLDTGDAVYLTAVRGYPLPSGWVWVELLIGEDGRLRFGAGGT